MGDGAARHACNGTGACCQACADEAAEERAAVTRSYIQARYGSGGRSYGLAQHIGPSWGGSGGGSGIAKAGYPNPYTYSSPGFGDREITPQPGFAAGAVHVYRWWSMLAPDFTRSPARAGETWPFSSLYGVYARQPWLPGLNTAVCLGNISGHDEAVVPSRSCGCGFWGFWNAQWYDMLGPDRIGVFGVIKAWGRTLFGTEGIRCEKARIVALHVPVELTPAVERPDPWEQAGFTGKVYYMGGTSRYVPREPDPRERATAEAWAAVIGDRLAQMYPHARVFEDQRALLKMFPLDPAATGLQKRSCRWCGLADLLDAAGHEGSCTANPYSWVNQV